jgi:Mrp family chromosome partitioning ATPase
MEGRALTAPLTSDRRRYQAGALGAANLRTRRGPSRPLAFGRLRRGVRRQWPVFLLTALVLTGLGVGYDLSGGVPLATTALFWSPLGLAGGLAVAFFAELSRNTVTSLSSFGKHRGYAILGAAPELTARVLRQLPPDSRDPVGCLTLQPASSFATAFRDLQASISQDNLVAFTGSLPGEGATTAAMCAAISATQQGRSVLIVDCDLRRRSLTRALGYDPDEGVLDACEQPDQWQSLVGEEDETGLHFMPASRQRSPWSLTAAPGFERLLANLRGAYDLVVLDCPPALTSAEAGAVASLADRVVLVTAWDRTPLNAVRKAMQVLHQRRGVHTGVYVNRVPPEYRFGRLRGD